MARRLLTRAGVAIAVAASGVLLAAPTASASGTATIEGAQATFQSHGDVFRLYDTRCDGNPVYLVYKVAGSEHRLDNSGGCGSHSTYNLSFPNGKGISYKACVDKNAWPDKCSGWTDDVA
jgi:hypothetical protein